MAVHSTNDCIHNETFDHISKTLDRLDNHTERAAVAMEEMAKQSVIISNHERRLGDHDAAFREAFSRVRILEELKNRYVGAEKVIEKRQKFWDGVKQQVTPYAIVGLIFMFWLIDKFNVTQFLSKMFKEMKG